MIPVVAVAVVGAWLLVQATAGRLGARLLSYRSGNLGLVDDGSAELPSMPSTPTSTSTTPGFMWPTTGRVSQELHDGHDGIDIANSAGTPVRSTFGGRVIYAAEGWNGGYGTQVKVDHGQGVQSWYNHLSRLDVRTGDQVAKGQGVGLMGSTGRSTGPHLHFEIRVNGVPRNPRDYIGGQP